MDGRFVDKMTAAGPRSARPDEGDVPCRQGHVHEWLARVAKQSDILMEQIAGLESRLSQHVLRPDSQTDPAQPEKGPEAHLVGIADSLRSVLGRLNSIERVIRSINDRLEL